MKTDGRAIVPPVAGLSIRPMLFIGDSLVSGFSPPFTGLVLPHGTFQAFGSVVIRILRARGVDARLEMVACPGAVSQFPAIKFKWAKKCLYNTPI